MIYYKADGREYEDFDSAKNRMYGSLLLECEELIKFYAKYNYVFNSRISTLMMANNLLNLIRQDNYNEILKIIKADTYLHIYAVHKKYTKKYNYKSDKLAKCLNDIAPLVKKEIFK